MAKDREYTESDQRAYRIEFAAEQLCRYSGEPKFDEFADVLDHLDRMNDDLYHNRTFSGIKEHADKAKAAIDKILELAKESLSPLSRDA